MDDGLLFARYMHNLCVCRMYAVCTDPTVCECVVFGELTYKFAVGMVSTENSQCPVQKVVQSGYCIGLSLALILDSSSITNNQYLCS